MNSTRACLQGLQLFKLSGPCRVAAFSSFRHGQILTKVGNQLTKWQSNLQCIPLTVSWRQMSEGKSGSALDKPDFDKLVKNNKVVVFMKGVPDEPRCGFSNAVVQIMRMHGVTNYDSHNVLADENIRQGIKEFTNWPTIPQVFINGEFVGGCDILIEMHKSGELVEQLGKVGIKSALLEEEAKK